MTKSAGPLEGILAEVERATAGRLWYLALAVTLSLPDICSLLLEPPAEAWSKRKKYAAWFDENLVGRFHLFTGDDCYNLRGGVLHHGHFGHKDSRYDRVIFLPPGSPVSIHDAIMTPHGTAERILCMDVERFCADMVDAVRDWYAAKQHDPVVQGNIPRLVRMRPGMPPWMIGIPVIF